MPRLPSLFLSHGAPTLALEDGPAHRFLKALGGEIGRPEAILMASAHWQSDGPVLGMAERPETIHDFYGFPPTLYEIGYPAPGAPQVARRAAAALEAAGVAATTDPDRGLDHGAWVPLMLMYPEADIPVAQVSLQTPLGPGHHLALGEALAPLRDEGVLLVGSGGFTHNLAEFRGQAPDSPAPDWVSEFAEWMAAAIDDHRRADLLAYRDRAPHGARNHPSEEHLLPLFVALGAGGSGARARRLHASITYGVLAMDAFAFGEG
jgi:4,5-DOPA dioxygenase extradiol